MEPTVFFWLIAALLFLLFEVGSPGLFLFLSFSFGSLAGAIANYYGFSIVPQSLAFLAGTLMSLFVLRYWLLAKLNEGKPHIRTNVHALHGKQGVILKAIEPSGVGQVKVRGEIWSARSAHNIVILKGAKIVVIRVSGSHVIVEEIL